MKFIIYGAYGYTGRLIVEEATRKGLKPTVAGRSKELTRALAEEYNLEYVCFEYNDHRAWDQALSNHDLLLNCAGPFSLTIKDILPACIRNMTHYTDITGEIKVFEYISQFDADAKLENLVLMPGTGFDVVPTDCLANYLKEQMPAATHLELGFDSPSGMSRGTALSLVNRLHEKSARRVDGQLEYFTTGTYHKTIDFGGKARNMAAIVWGDVFTAYKSTGIPNITVYTALPIKLMRLLGRAEKFSWFLSWGPIKRMLMNQVRKRVTGPNSEKRATLSSHVWGKVTDANGNELKAEMKVPESYSLTAITAIKCVERILNGEVNPGFYTPAQAFGFNFIMEVEGVTRKVID